MFRALSREHPDVASAIGRMLGGYTELEFGLLGCIEVVMDDFDSLFKAMFRTRGETQRLEIADALGRYKFHSINLGTDFEMLMGSLQYCRKIRNQYAHCHWYTTPSDFGFVDLEEVAKESARATNESMFTYRRLSDSIVKTQEDYFKLTDDLLIWLEIEAEVKKGTKAKNQYSKPKQVTQPLLYTPQG